MMHWANVFTLNPIEWAPLYTVYFHIKRNDLCWSAHTTTIDICVHWILWVTNSHTTVGFGAHNAKRKCCIEEAQNRTFSHEVLNMKHCFVSQKHFLWGGKVALLLAATFHYPITTAAAAATANIAFYTNNKIVTLTLNPSHRFAVASRIPLSKAIDWSQ